jgi:uncharacterized membrane protein
MNDFILFLGGGSLLASLVIGSLKEFIKKNIAPRYGDLGVNIALFVIALIISFVYWGMKFLPTEVISTATIILAGAIAIYEVLFKAILNKAIKGQLDEDEK